MPSSGVGAARAAAAPQKRRPSFQKGAFLSHFFPQHDHHRRSLFRLPSIVYRLISNLSPLSLFSFRSIVHEDVVQLAVEGVFLFPSHVFHGKDSAFLGDDAEGEEVGLLFISLLIQLPLEFLFKRFLFSGIEDGHEGAAGVVHEVFEAVAFQKVDHATVGEEDFLVLCGPAHHHAAGHAAGHFGEVEAELGAVFVSATVSSNRRQPALPFSFTA